MTVGLSGARVSRRAGVYRKESDNPDLDLLGEGARLRWLREHGIPAPEVLDCRPGLLVTAEVPGRSAAEPWPEPLRPRVVDALAGLTRRLHALPVEECPFDRRLAAVLPGFPAEMAATRPAAEDPVVCHGDLCVPNVLLDPETCQVTGVIDAGNLGVADRWVDLAIATRSLTSDLNPQYGPWAAERYLRAYGIAPEPEKIAYYRRIDELL